MDSINAVPAVTSVSSTSNTNDAYSQMMRQEWAQFQVLMDLAMLIKLLFGNLKGMEKGKKQVKVNNKLSDIHFTLSHTPSAFSSPATKDLNKLLGSKAITLDMLVNCLLDVLYQNDPQDNPITKMKEEIQKNITDALQGISPETSETIDSSSTDKIEKLLAALKDPQQALSNML